MPGIVAGRLGVRGRVVFEVDEGVEGVEGNEGEGKAPLRGSEWVRMYERSPRGSLGTFARLTGEGGWLRGRNSLLKDFGGKEGRSRVLVCEGGVCREEGGDDEAVGTDTAVDALKEGVLNEGENVSSPTPSGTVKDTEAKVAEASLPVTTSAESKENQKSL